LFHQPFFTPDATCGFPDVFKRDPKGLKGQTLRIALLNTPSGWTGSYSKTGVHFKGPIEDWYGPAVDLIVEAARLGEFNLELMEDPPTFLIDKAQEFFNASTAYTLCIYMASLGFVDLCINEYSLASKFTAITDLIILNSQDLVLVAKAKQDTTGWQDFKNNIYLVFKPFKPQVWAFTNLFVIPIFGFLMVYHERASNGSVHPTEETVIIQDESTGDVIITEKRVPIGRDIFKGWYVTMLSAQQGAWGQRVVSTGGKLNLVGIAFFILTINSVYTANLAAVLYRQRSKVIVKSIKDAVRAGQTLCIDRIQVDYIVARYDLQSTFLFALDSDGEPGFAPCDDNAIAIGCDAQVSRYLDFIDPLKAAEKDNVHYCHAAIVTRDEYDLVQSRNKHCDKAVVSVVGNTFVGMPIFAAKSDAFGPLINSLRNNYFYDQLLFDQQPKSMCPEISISAGGDTSSLDFVQLSGIWAGSGLFVVAGLGYALFESYKRRKSGKLMSKVLKRDQFGEEIHALKREDSWIHDRYTVDALGRKIVSDPFDLSRNRSVGLSSMRSVRRQLMTRVNAAKKVVRDGLESSRNSVDRERRKLGASPRRRQFGDRSSDFIGADFSDSTKIVHTNDATCKASLASDSTDESWSKLHPRGSNDEGSLVTEVRDFSKLYISTPFPAVPTVSDANDSSSATLLIELMDALLPYPADKVEEWKDEVEEPSKTKKKKIKSQRSGLGDVERDPIEKARQIPKRKKSSNKSKVVDLADDRDPRALSRGKTKSKKVIPSKLLDSANNPKSTKKKFKSPIQSDIEQGRQVATMSETKWSAPTFGRGPVIEVRPTPPTHSKRALTPLEAEILRMGMESE
jgi:hypothetical protein